MTTKVKLSRVRINFFKNSLFTASEYTPGDGKPRFTAYFYVEPGSQNAKMIDAAIAAEVAGSDWGKTEALKKAKFDSIKANNMKCAYTDGDLKEWAGSAGNMILAAHSKVRPLVIGPVGVTKEADKEPGREYTDPSATGIMFPILTMQDGKPYPGSYVNATVEIYAQNGENWGLRGGFKGVQFVKDGDAFGGGAPASPDDFDNEDLSTENEGGGDDLAG